MSILHYSCILLPQSLIRSADAGVLAQGTSQNLGGQLDTFVLLVLQQFNKYINYIQNCMPVISEILENTYFQYHRPEF